MGTKSRETHLRGSVRRLRSRRWKHASEPTGLPARHGPRMLGFKGPAQPTPTLGDALNAGYCYLERLALWNLRNVQLIERLFT